MAQVFMGTDRELEAHERHLAELARKARANDTAQVAGGGAQETADGQQSGAGNEVVSATTAGRVQQVFRGHHKQA